MVEFTTYKGTKEGAIVEAKATREIKSGQVLVKITHSGLCGTDLHYKSSGIALGHEGAGVVEELGANVRNLKKGDRVGWGYEHDCCGSCKQCLRGAETFCPERAMYGDADTDQASMGTHWVGNESFLFKIPDAIPNEAAAPLMCGG